MCIFRQKFVMGVPFIKNKQTNTHLCEPFQLNLLGSGSGPALIMGNAAKWPVARVLLPPCLARTVQTTGTKKNAPLPRHAISHPGRQLKCKLKMLIRTVSTSILMHKMGILYSVQRRMHCSSGKTLPPLLLLFENLIAVKKNKKRK